MHASALDSDQSMNWCKASSKQRWCELQSGRLHIPNNCIKIRTGSDRGQSKSLRRNATERASSPELCLLNIPKQCGVRKQNTHKICLCLGFFRANEGQKLIPIHVYWSESSSLLLSFHDRGGGDTFQWTRYETVLRSFSKRISSSI